LEQLIKLIEPMEALS